MAKEKAKKGSTTVVEANDVASSVGGWQVAEFVADKCPSLGAQSLDSARQLVRLLDEGNEVPFIARYRRNVIGDIPVEDIRLAVSAYNSAKEIKARAATVLSKLESTLTSPKEKAEVRMRIEQAKSLIDLDAIYEPFKPAKAGSLASRAKEVGLEPLAVDLLHGRHVALEKAVVPSVSGVKNVSEVKKGVMHIAADYIVKQTETQIFIKETSEPKERMRVRIDVCSSLSRAAKKMEKNSAKLMQFKDYHQFTKPASFITNHQVLAIERGENDKILSMKIQPANHLFNEFQNFIYTKLGLRIHPTHKQLFNEIIADCYKRLVEPAIERCVWRLLIERAHESSIECFARNLHQLLLTPPLKNIPIIAIDPGYKNGCKVALISESSTVLHTGVFYLDSRQSKTVRPDHERFFKSVVSNIPKTHKEVKIAIGNGTACRETEVVVAQLIKQRVFDPFAVEYCIVSECGASVYSASDLAGKELGKLDINIRSAVSIARRLQDPLAEYVKIDPKHLGVGMYQHSLNEKDLHRSLDTVVRECVSSVGVDANTCSLELLQKVAGLNRRTATNVLAYREQHTRIRSRDELRGIAGIGPKSFEQCAGFINVYDGDDGMTTRKEDDGEPSTKRRRLNARGNDHSYCPLDATTVHPESYSLAKKLIAYVGCLLDDVGTEKLRRQLIASKDRLFADASVRDEAQLRLVFDALVQPLRFDLRRAFAGPVFRDSFKTIASLSAGDRLDGIITNVTDFGAFVDVGVGSNGLVHRSSLAREDADNMAKLLQVRRLSASYSQLYDRDWVRGGGADPPRRPKCANRTGAARSLYSGGRPRIDGRRRQRLSTAGASCGGVVLCKQLLAASTDAAARRPSPLRPPPTVGNLLAPARRRFRRVPSAAVCTRGACRQQLVLFRSTGASKSPSSTWTWDDSASACGWWRSRVDSCAPQDHHHRTDAYGGEDSSGCRDAANL
uniref:S1 motif domain-containing protein n=1 Tax=Plectus sambesii TaxID=2011161 RepID=A0A914VHL8_9BILA